MDSLEELLREKPQLRAYIRSHPRWYRLLSRNPQAAAELEAEAREYYGQSWTQRAEKLGRSLEMLKLFHDLAAEMGED